MIVFLRMQPLRWWFFACDHSVNQWFCLTSIVDVYVWNGYLHLRALLLVVLSVWVSELGYLWAIIYTEDIGMPYQFHLAIVLWTLCPHFCQLTPLAIWQQESHYWQLPWSISNREYNWKGTSARYKYHCITPNTDRNYVLMYDPKHGEVEVYNRYVSHWIYIYTYIWLTLKYIYIYMYTYMHA